MLDTELKAALDAHGAAIETAMKKYDAQFAETGKVSDATKNELRELSAKFESTITEITQKMEKALGSNTPAYKTPGQEFIESEAFKKLASGQAEKVRVEVKNTVSSGSTTVFPQQNPGIIPGAFLPLTLRQMLIEIPVTTNAVNSLRELAWTNAAAETSQGAAKPESSITFEPYNVMIQTVPHFIKVTNQLLADAPAVVAYIDLRLRDGLAQRIDLQLLKGNGTSPNLSGLTKSGNYTAYTPTSGDLLVDAINRAKWAMWAAGEQPDTVICNPADWGAMERTREQYANGMKGEYLYGTPGMSAPMNPFGLRVAINPNMTSGKFLVGALRSSTTLYVRQGATIEMGYVNDDFTKNLVTIRAEERMGLGVERPAGLYYGSFTA